MASITGRNINVTYSYNNNDGQGLFGYYPDGVPLNPNLTIDDEPVLDAETLCLNTPDQPCWQWNTNKWMLMFAEEVLNFKHGKLPDVFSISYGYPLIARWCSRSATFQAALRMQRCTQGCPRQACHRPFNSRGQSGRATLTAAAPLL